jgi:hypothetical protein
MNSNTVICDEMWDELEQFVSYDLNEDEDTDTNNNY